MNTEEARVKTSGRQGRGHGDDERGVEPARDRDLRGVRLKYFATWVYRRKRSSRTTFAFRHRRPRVLTAGVNMRR